MTELIGEIFSTIFNGNVILATIFVSMVPIMELKGGIPFAMSEAFWGAKALGRWQAFGWAYLGCSIVVVFLYFAFVPIMKFLRKTKIFKGLANYIDKKVSSKSSQMMQEKTVDTEVVVSEGDEIKVKTSKTRFYKLLGVFVFTAIPLPLTGIWMGTCLAVVLGLNFWETMISVQVGNLIAGIIISTICVIFPQFTHVLIYVFLILVAVVLIYEIIANKIKKNKQKNKN
ncbi:MAG: small multi-drug export protein [Clostridia bacterium]|nr:small multi-drug export protein [Clostridia bacterium]